MHKLTAAAIHVKNQTRNTHTDRVYYFVMAAPVYARVLNSYTDRTRKFQTVGCTIKSLVFYFSV